MIDRSIIHNPDKPFDFFNDYENTDNWLAFMVDAASGEEKQKLQSCRDRLRERKLSCGGIGTRTGSKVASII